MSKTNKPNTRKKLGSIFGTPLTRDYLKQNPVTDSMIKYVCDKLIEYACKEDSTFVAIFLRDMRIPRVTFFNWTKKYPQLAEAVKEAKYIIGYNRMEGCIKRRFDKGSVLHSQYRYGKEWEEDDEHHASLKKEEQEANIKRVFIEEIPYKKQIQEKK